MVADLVGLAQQALDATLAVQYELATTHAAQVATVAALLLGTLRAGGKILLCGNGGSAADAQHVATELVGRFQRERRALPAIALTTDTSLLTAIGNDYGYERVFARQVEALARAGDLVVGISTSGNAASVLAAMRAARELGATTLGFTGRSGGQLRTAVDHCYCAPGDLTAHIQEAHIVVWHAVCQIIETELFA